MDKIKLDIPKPEENLSNIITKIFWLKNISLLMNKSHYPPIIVLSIFFHLPILL